MFQGLRYRRRRFRFSNLVRKLFVPLLLILALFLTALTFLNSSFIRVPEGERGYVKLERETGVRPTVVDGLGLSMQGGLESNLLREGSFDALNFRRELLLRALGGRAFAVVSSSGSPETYRSAELPPAETLALFESGAMSVDRVGQGIRERVSSGVLHSGQDDQILEIQPLSVMAQPLWQSLQRVCDDEGRLVTSYVLLNTGEVARNIHSELMQPLPGRVPARARSLFLLRDSLYLWTDQGAIYLYQPAAERWQILVDPIPDENFTLLIPLNDSELMARGQEGLYTIEISVESDAPDDEENSPDLSTQKPIWQLLPEQEEAFKPRQWARAGDSLYALTEDNWLYGYAPKRGFLEDGKVAHAKDSAFERGAFRWQPLVQLEGGAELRQDLEGELLLLIAERGFYWPLSPLKVVNDSPLDPETEENFEALITRALPWLQDPELSEAEDREAKDDDAKDSETSDSDADEAESSVEAEAATEDREEPEEETTDRGRSAKDDDAETRELPDVEAQRVNLTRLNRSETGYAASLKYQLEHHEQAARRYKKLVPMSRGRVLALSENAPNVLLNGSAQQELKFSDGSLRSENLVPLDETMVLSVTRGRLQLLRLGAVLYCDLEPPVPEGDLYLVTLEQSLSPERYEQLGGAYPWVLESGYLSYLEEPSSEDTILPSYSSSQLLLSRTPLTDEAPQEADSPEAAGQTAARQDSDGEVAILRQSIPIPEGVGGDELMTLGFRARTQSTESSHRLRVEFEGPFHSFDLQSERISDEPRNYQIPFHLPKFQQDREVNSVDVILRWTGDAPLVIDDLRLMTRENWQEGGLPAELKRGIQRIQPARLRFELLPDGNSETMLTYGLEDPNFRQALNHSLQFCEQEGVDPWIVLPSTWTPDEQAALFQYLAADISEEYGRQRLKDGWSQAWLRRLPRVYFELSPMHQMPHDDATQAASLNRVLRAVMQTSAYDAVKNQVTFLDGVDYASGQMLSVADGHVMKLRISDIPKTSEMTPGSATVSDETSGEEAQSITLGRLEDYYYTASPRLRDQALSWIGSVEDDPEHPTTLPVLAAYVLEMQQTQNQGINLDQSLYYGAKLPPYRWQSHASLTSEQESQLDFWLMMHEFTQGELLNVSLEFPASEDAQSSTFKIMAVEDGSEIKIVLVADPKGERQHLSFAWPEGYDAKGMRLYRYDRAGRLYEDRNLKRAQNEWSLEPGDVLFIGLSSDR